MNIMQTFTKENFEQICQILASQDIDFQRIIDTHGIPPMWTREPSFATLIHIILEQQVSIMAAKACFEKLKFKIGKVEPEYVLALTDDELKACGFSRQKMGYARILGHEILRGSLVLENLQHLDNEQVRTEIKRIKGLGDWSVDIFLMFALQRSDMFPIGDLALVNGLKTLKNLPKETPKEALLALAESWRPYRSVATFLVWHDYIIRKGIVL
jgi:DNA-3-methyladenine glycosylase II